MCAILYINTVNFIGNSTIYDHTYRNERTSTPLSSTLHFYQLQWFWSYIITNFTYTSSNKYTRTNWYHFLPDFLKTSCWTNFFGALWFLLKIWFTKELVFLRLRIWREFIPLLILLPNLDIDIVFWLLGFFSILKLSGRGWKLSSLVKGLYSFLTDGRVSSRNLFNFAISYSAGIWS